MAKTQIKKLVQGPLTAAAQDEEGNALPPVVTFKFPDDTEQSLDLSTLSPDVIMRLAIHGASQKIGDSFAGAASEENPLAYAKGRVADVMKQLQNAEWRVTVAGGPRATLLARALARITGEDLEDCIEVVENLEDEQKKALRKDPRIKQASADIKLEDAQKAKERAAAAGGVDNADAQADLGSLFS